jgi:hypothetical protein
MTHKLHHLRWTHQCGGAEKKLTHVSLSEWGSQGPWTSQIMIVDQLRESCVALRYNCGVLRDKSEVSRFVKTIQYRFNYRVFGVTVFSKTL